MMAFFLRFMGWLILWSLMYFLALDCMGLGPGQDPRLVSAVILLASFPVWWFTWKRFERTFGARPSQALEGGKTAYLFSLRNPALMYYLMVLKLFLLAMGANGIITLAHHEGAMRTFYIWNFIILYIYAIPFFLIKCLKLKKALGSRLVADASGLSLQHNGQALADIRFASLDRLCVEEATRGMLIEAGGEQLYLGGQKAKGSGFYIEGIEEVYAGLKAAAGDKQELVASIKETLKAAGFKPAV
ncbi:hypothetical protein ACFL43_01445 [Thermodesulfobacteriota bacterium]